MSCFRGHFDGALQTLIDILVVYDRRDGLSFILYLCEANEVAKAKFLVDDSPRHHDVLHDLCRVQPNLVFPRSK